MCGEADWYRNCCLMHKDIKRRDLPRAALLKCAWAEGRDCLRTSLSSSNIRIIHGFGYHKLRGQKSQIQVKKYGYVGKNRKLHPMFETLEALK